MIYMRPASNTLKPIALSDSQKNALAAAMSEPGESSRQIETARVAATNSLEERQQAKDEELLFIL